MDQSTPKVYKNIDDVYNELILLEKKTKENGGEVGKGLYNVLPFFVNDEKLEEIECYNTILKIAYCKQSKTPPFQTLQDTPAKFVDEYMIVSSEINSLIDDERERNKTNVNG